MLLECRKWWLKAWYALSALPATLSYSSYRNAYIYVCVCVYTHTQSVRVYILQRSKYDSKHPPHPNPVGFKVIITLCCPYEDPAPTVLGHYFSLHFPRDFPPSLNLLINSNRQAFQYLPIVLTNLKRSTCSGFR